MIKIIVGRADGKEQKELQISFPVSQVELDAMKSRYAEKLVIKNMESDIPNLADYLREFEIFDHSYSNKLNSLAARIESLTPDEKEKFKAAIEFEPVNNYDDLYHLTFCLDEYEYFPDIHDKASLGKFLVETRRVPVHESALPFIDYEKVSAEFLEGSNAVFTDKGCVVEKDENNVSIQRAEEKSRACVFNVSVTSKYLISAYSPPVSLKLPAGKLTLTEAVRNLRIGNINECFIAELSSPMTELNKISTGDANFSTLNSIAEQIEDLSERGGKLPKLLAALEIESPADFEAVYEIINNLDNYELMPESVRDCEDYGRYILFDSGEIGDIGDEIEGYMDYDEYGKDKMLEEGIRETAFGLLRKLDVPFPEETHSQGMAIN